MLNSTHRLIQQFITVVGDAIFGHNVSYILAHNGPTGENDRLSFVDDLNTSMMHHASCMVTDRLRNACDACQCHDSRMNNHVSGCISPASQTVDMVIDDIVACLRDTWSRPCWRKEMHGKVRAELNKCCTNCYVPRTGVNTVKSKDVARISLVNSPLMPRIP